MMKIDISIKKRLMISSIFMVGMIVVVAAFLFYGGRIVYIKLHGTPLGSEKMHPEYFSKMVTLTREKYLKPWKEDFDIDKVLVEAAEWNEQYRKKGFNLAIYDKHKLLTKEATAIDQNIANLIFSKKGEHYLIFDGIGVFTTMIDRYAIVIGFNAMVPKIFNYNEMREVLLLLVITVTLILTLFIVNIFLMRFVARPINVAMAALMEGIRHIRDGEFNYKIVYRGQDEFTEICDDFNEMAWRLGSSKNRIQREEQVRKELIAGISHDLHTPLASIKAYVEGLAKGVANTPEKQRHYLNILARKTEIMEKIIDQLFTFSKLDLETFPLHLVRVDLAKEIARVVNELKVEHGDPILSIDIADDPPALKVDIDRGLFQNTLVNIVENSLKYKDKDRVTISVELATCKEGYVEVAVRDDGPGVDEDELQKIFDVFYRCDESRCDAEKGSGLGLAIASKTVAQFGGAMRAENAPGGGLAVIITLPVKE